MPSTLERVLGSSPRRLEDFMRSNDFKRRTPSSNPPPPAPRVRFDSRSSSTSKSSSSAPKASSKPAASAPAAPARSGSLDLDAIRSALAAIAAQFDFQEGSLTAEQEAAKRAYGFLTEQFADQRSEALDRTRGEAAGRGLLRSGLFLRESGDVSERFAKSQSQAQAERDARLAAIANNIASLKAQEEAQKAETARNLAKEQVGTAEAIAQALQLV